MSQMNITIDDASPQLWYYNINGTRGWDNGAIGNDVTAQQQSYKGTFTRTRGENNFMFFRFNASSIWLYGSRWNNHGAYTSQVDENEPSIRQAYASNRWFHSNLVAVTGLQSSRDHTLRLTNQPSLSQRYLGPWRDVDYIILGVQTDGRVRTTRIDDMGPEFSYNGEWSGNTQAPQGFFNLSSHTSSRAGDSATLSFTGISVQLFGSLRDTHGNYTISVDGVEQEGQYNASFPRTFSDVPLWTMAGLTDTAHTLTITNQGGAQGATIEIDYAVVNSTQAGAAASSSPSPVAASGSQTSGTGSSSTASLPSPSSSAGSTNQQDTGTGAAANSSTSSSNDVPIGAIVGGVIGGILAIGLLGILAWYLRRKLRIEEHNTVYSGAASQRSGPRSFAGGSIVGGRNGGSGPDMRQNSGYFSPRSEFSTHGGLLSPRGLLSPSDPFVTPYHSPDPNAVGLAAGAGAGQARSTGSQSTGHGQDDRYPQTYGQQHHTYGQGQYIEPNQGMAGPSLRVTPSITTQHTNGSGSGRSASQSANTHSISAYSGYVSRDGAPEYVSQAAVQTAEKRVLRS